MEGMGELEGQIARLGDEMREVQRCVRQAHEDMREEVAKSCALSSAVLCAVLFGCVIDERSSAQSLLFLLVVLGWFGFYQHRTLKRLHETEPPGPELPPRVYLSSPMSHASEEALPGSPPVPASMDAALAGVDKVYRSRGSSAGSDWSVSTSSTTAAEVCTQRTQGAEPDAEPDAPVVTTVRRSSTSSLASIDFGHDKVDGYVVKSRGERAAVEKLRARLANVNESELSPSQDLSDKTLIRFVRARNLDLDASEEMFRDALTWRKVADPEDIYRRIETNPHPLMTTCFTGGWCMHDKDGAPVMIDRIGLMDVPGLMATIHSSKSDFTAKHVVDFHTWRQETHTRKMIEAEALFGQPQYQIVVISDMAGLGMKHFNRAGFKILRELLHIDDTYYPERLKVQYIINAPRIFSAIWSVVKTFLAPNTRAKIHIFSNCPTGDLLEIIHEDKLPEFLGGKLVIEGDPYCASLVKPGSKFPR